MTSLILVLCLAALRSAPSDTLYAVDLYGLRTTTEATVRAAIGLGAGDLLPASLDSVRVRLQRIPGVEEIHLAPVCCSENGRTILYVGIRERRTPPVTFRSPPAGSGRLPDELVEAGSRFESALIRGVQQGITGEDHSHGYALADDAALRAVQQDFVRLAAQHLDTLIAVARHSADARHRALAVQIIAYSPDRHRVTRELLYAVSDPSEGVRNNAARALAVLADWAKENSSSGITIPPDGLVELLNSISWTDRNKGVMVLLPLTAARDSAVLAEIRTSALRSVTEMARWTNTGHALGPFILVARVAGVDDAEAFQAFQSGERERIIARALAAPR